jgi:HEAT repeat protein
MRLKLHHFIRKVFGIFPGEEKNVFRFITLATVWAIGSCIADTLGIGLFTEQIGAAFLPNAYLIIALILIGVSCLYIYLLRFTSPYKIMIFTMSIAAVAYSIITVALFTTPPRWFWYFLKIFSHIFSSSLMACFWIFLDQYHDLQDAKRLFGVYNAAYFLGYVISGTLINRAYKTLGPAVLFSIVVITMIISIFQAKKITTKVPVMEDDVTEDYFSGGKKTFSVIFREFCKSPYTTFVVAMSLIVQLLRTCTEYGYLDSIQKLFTATPAIAIDSSIPILLGKLKAFIAAINIIIGIFFYRKMVTRIGVANLILLPPIYFMFLYSEWSLYESLFMVILAIVAIECILFTVEDNNFNLLINAAPVKLRGVLRLINDSFFEPVGMLFSTVFLLLLKDQNKIFGLMLSVIFIGLAIFVRYFYPISIFKALKENSLRFKRKTIDWIKKMSIKEKKETKRALLEALNSENQTTKLLALETLLAFNDYKLLEKVLFSIANLQSNEKSSAIDILENSSFSNDSKVIDLINDFKEYSNDDSIIKKSHLYLAKKGLINPEKIKVDLDSKDLILRASAIISLKHFKSNDAILNASLNRTIAQKELQLLFNFNQTDEICMGLEILSLDDSDEAVAAAIKYLSHENLTIKRKAASALAKITDKSDSKYASKIIEAIKNATDIQLRINCLKALGNINDSTTIKDIIKLSYNLRPIVRRTAEDIIIKMGLKTVPHLTAILKDMTLNERARILAGKILAKLSLAHLKNNLIDIVTVEIEKAHFYFYWAKTIQNKYPLYDLSLLQNALQTGYKSIIDFIIYILAEASLIEDCELIVKALHSKTTKSHAHAIETLEKSIQRDLFSQILPLIDDSPLEYKLQLSAKQIDTSLNLKQLLDKLENSHLFFDKIIAAHLKAKLQMPNWQQSLREQIKKSDESFHQFTYELLEL